MPAHISRSRRLLVLLLGTLYMLGSTYLEHSPRGLWQGMEWAAETLTTTGYGADARWHSSLMTLFVIVAQFLSLFLVLMIFPVYVLPYFEERFESRLPRALPDMGRRVLFYCYGPAVDSLVFAPVGGQPPGRAPSTTRDGRSPKGLASYPGIVFAPVGGQPPGRAPSTTREGAVAERARLLPRNRLCAGGRAAPWPSSQYHARGAIAEGARLLQAGDGRVVPAAGGRPRPNPRRSDGPALQHHHAARLDPIL